MLSDVTLRPLTPDDQPLLEALFQANDVPEVTRWFDPFPLDQASARTLCEHTGRDLYWGVWDDSTLVGLATVRGWDDGHPQPAFGLLVDRDHAGRGVGKAATRLAVAELRASGVPEVRARVHDDNEYSLRMLHAAGYVEIERGSGRVLLAAHPLATG